MGDPIEAEAIHNAFQRSKDNPLYIGALKTNIGHLEAASGIAGLIKTTLVLERGIIPPNIWFERPPQAIRADEWRLKVRYLRIHQGRGLLRCPQFPTCPTPWPTSGLRRASVNSFGYGGSNCHAIIDDAYHYFSVRGIQAKHRTIIEPSLSLLSLSLPATGRPPTSSVSLNADQGIQTSEIELTSRTIDPVTNVQVEAAASSYNRKVFIWSTSDEQGLARLITDFRKYLDRNATASAQNEADFLDDLAYTLSNKRSRLPWKASVVADSLESLMQGLADNLSKPNRSSVAPSISFVFTGQGSQWAGMGCKLLHYPVFQASLSRASSFLESLGCEWYLIGMCTGNFCFTD